MGSQLLACRQQPRTAFELIYTSPSVARRHDPAQCHRIKVRFDAATTPKARDGSELCPAEYGLHDYCIASRATSVRVANEEPWPWIQSFRRHSLHEPLSSPCLLFDESQRKPSSQLRSTIA